MAKRARPGDFRGSKSAKKRARTGRTNRRGFSSVARTRGAAVTGEMKYYDTAVAATALAASAGWTGTEFDPAVEGTLCVPVVGAAVNQRIGKAIKIMKIKIRGTLSVAAQAGQVTGDTPTVIRLILHQDMQTNSTQAQGEQVMTAAASAAVAVNTFQNIDNFGRFRVLTDKTITIENPNMAGEVGVPNIIQAGLSRNFKITHNFRKPVVVRFNATNGGTFADIIDNSFHLICNASNVSALAPNINYVARVCYKE